MSKLKYLIPFLLFPAIVWAANKPTIIKSTELANLNQGLVGWWTFDGNTMTKTVGDSSGNSYQGYLLNYTATTTTQGKIGQAMKFNGKNQYVDITPGTGTNANYTSLNFADLSPWTFATWIFSPINSPANSNIPFAGAYGNSFNSWFSVRRSGNNEFRYIGQNGSEQNMGDSTNYFAKSTWFHTVWSMDSSRNLTLYVNGVAQSTKAFTSSAIVFQVLGQGVNLFFTGSLDDVRVYNYALSTTTIQQLYNYGKTKLTPADVPIPTNDIVGWWTFDGNKMINNVTDSSGQGNTGYMKGFTSTTTVAGKIGQALRFDGVNNVVNAGTSAAFNVTQVTVSAWVKDTRNWSGGSGYQNLFDRGPSQSSAGNESYSLIMRTNGANAQFFEMRVSDGTSINTADSATGVTNSNRWVHVVGTYTGGTTRLYVDGVLVATASGGGTINNTPTDGTTACIGGDIVEGRNYWNGQIDDVRVYNRALTATEITQLYNYGKVKLRL